MFSFENIDTTRWKNVLDDQFNAKDKALFEKRKEAIDMYLSRNSLIKEITLKTGIRKLEIYRLLSRCLSVDDQGEVWGYRALIPGKRIKRSKFSDEKIGESRGSTGRFQIFLEKYPAIKEKIQDLYFNQDKRTVKESIMKPIYIWKYFIDSCRQLGITMSDYPLNTKDKGRRSLERYLIALENENYERSAKRYGKDAARHANVTGQGRQNYSTPKTPFSKVQFDGHRINAVFTVTFETPERYQLTKVMERPWLLLILDVTTRCILGWSISFNSEYTAIDVMTCIKNALEPWTPKTFTIDELNYSPTGGFPSGIYPEAAWAAWDEFMIDNGKANLSNITVEKLIKTVGCSVNPGPVSTPERRNLIERLFGVLAERGYNRLPSTVGQNPKDPRNKNSAQKAEKFEISYLHLFELTETLIANYNGTPHGGIHYFTPLELLKQCIDKGYEIRKIPEFSRNIATFLSFKTTRKICGKKEGGKRPYIVFEGVVYRNEVLVKSWGLLGKNLTLSVNPQDLRFIIAYLEDGSELGVLRANGKWGEILHSLKTRQEINQLKEKLILHFTTYDDPIQIYINYLQKKSKEKSSVSKLARLNEEKKAHSLLNNYINMDLEEFSSIEYKGDSKIEEFNDRDEELHFKNQLEIQQQHFNQLNHEITENVIARNFSKRPTIIF